jgi:sugar lactone lactonase YvrE
MRIVSRIAAALLAFVIVLGAAPAQAAVPIRTVVSFDPSAGELPEGVAMDVRGDAYVDFINPNAQLIRIAPDGDRSLVTHFDVGGFGPLGMALDASGRLYVAVSSFDPATRGVYRVWPDGSTARLPGTEQIVFPNGLALDHDGTIYATDSASGAVWRIPQGGSATLWSQDPLLAGDGSLGLGFPLGANGIAVAQQHAVVVSNTEGAQVVRIPIERDGAAGHPEVIAEGPQLYGSDGIALDAFGRIYDAVNSQNTLVRVDANGSVTQLASAAEGLDNPASLSFGTSGGQRRALFLTNFAAFSSTPHPGLLEADVGAPGLPVP